MASGRCGRAPGSWARHRPGARLRRWYEADRASGDRVGRTAPEPLRGGGSRSEGVRRAGEVPPALSALPGQSRGGLLRVAGREPLQPLLPGRRASPQDDLLMDALRYCERMFRASRVTGLLGVLLVVALLASSASLGSRETTAPGNHVIV